MDLGTLTQKRQLLVTGDYWHPDFADLIKSSPVPLLLSPLDHVAKVAETGEAIRLIVLAQARRSQFEITDWEYLVNLLPGVPVVNLLGSWCEGETRSGTPLPGCVRIFWYQWRGRLNRFLRQLDQSGLTDWDLPRTSSLADRALNQPARRVRRSNRVVCVIAKSLSQFEMIADALDSIGLPSVWSPLEASTMTLPSNLEDECGGILVDADSLTPQIQQLIENLRVQFTNCRMTLLLGFPRIHEVNWSKDWQVEVVGKPFELTDLEFALVGAEA